MSEAKAAPHAGVFEALEAALSQNTFGRSFLEELATRSRQNDIARLLDGFEELKDAVSHQRSNTQLDILRGELKGMAEAIVTAKKEIASIDKPDLPQSRITAATEELDAIVTSTERATSDILGAAERLSETAQKLRDTDDPKAIADELDNQVMNIFTACSFQDLTGQRINKVVNVMHYLENRLDSMLEIWGVAAGVGDTNDPGMRDQPYNPMDTRPDAHLLSGPALEGMGVSQDDVDRMLSGEEPAETPGAEPAPAPVEAEAVAEAAPTESEPAQAAAPAPQPAPAAAAPAAAEEEEVEIGQDEIDNLFADEESAA